MDGAGYTQLKMLDVKTVGKLLHRCMPSSWLTGRSPVVEWNPSSFGHPPPGWLESVWQFLVNHAARDLTFVDGLPLIPSRSVPDGAVTVTELVPLSSARTCVARLMDGLTLSVDVEEVLRSIGVTVVDELPDYVKSHPLVVRQYVFSPTYLGVLRAVERRCSADGVPAIASLIGDRATADQKRALRQLFGKLSVYELSRDYADLLAELPLFEAADGSGRGATGDRAGTEPQPAAAASSSTFFAASMMSAAAPAERLPFRMSRPLLDTTSPDAQALGKLLGIKSLNMAQLLMQVITIIIIIVVATTTTPQPFCGPFSGTSPGEPMPEENFWTLWCKGRLTEADILTIRLGATTSGLTSS